MYDKAFPDDHLASNIVLVLHRDPVDKSTLNGDLKFIEDTLEPALRGIANADGGVAVNAAAPPADEQLLWDKPAAPLSSLCRPDARQTIDHGQHSHAQRS